MSLVHTIVTEELDDARGVAALPTDRRKAALTTVRHKVTVRALIYGATLDRARAAGAAYEDRCRDLVRALDLARGLVVPAKAAGV